MNCIEHVQEIVDCARARVKPGDELQAHLARCGACAERWEAECRLTAQLRMMRVRGIALTAHDTRRDALMRNFAEMHRKRPVRPWVLALGAAAALFAAIIGGHVAGTRLRTAHQPAHATPAALVTAVADYETSSDAITISSDEFVAVPYTPPLAQGELVRVVHADLHPEALASLGIDVDPEWTNDIPTDVVVGEDGIPRAVRITGDTQDEF